jgi:hypothetical protein
MEVLRAELQPFYHLQTLPHLANPNRASQVIWCPLLDIPRFVRTPSLRKHIADLSQYYSRKAGTTGTHQPDHVRYAVRQVLIDHSNVVYGGSQSFFISAHHRTWTVRVLLFSLRIEVRDAFFGFPTGSSVRVTLPSGASRVAALRDGHDVVLAGLPRATYQLVPAGPGLGLSAPARLSKAQTAKLLVLSWLDMGTLAVAAVLFLVGLPLLGGRLARRPGGKLLPSWHATTGALPAARTTRADTTGRGKP